MGELGDTSPSCSKDWFWGSSKSDEKLVRGRGWGTLCQLFQSRNKCCPAIVLTLLSHSIKLDVLVVSSSEIDCLERKTVSEMICYVSIGT